MKCPFAIWRPLPENETADLIDPRVVVLHTAVSQASSLWGYFNTPGVIVETHFYIRNDGSIEQYLDTNRQADGNRLANEFAVSVENQDNAGSPIVPMTPAQLASNIKLFGWLSDVHPKIRRQRCDRWNGSGYGYHTMWGAPSEWTPARGKTCPGPARIKQFDQIMIPALINTLPSNEEDLMDLAGNPSWVKRQPNNRFPVFIGHGEPQTNSFAVLSRDNAAFNPPWVEGRRDAGSEDGKVYGLWFRRFFNTGPFFGFGEAEGSFFAIAQNGTYDIAKR